MNPKKNYYAVLGLMPDAEDIVIVAAYRALVSRYHPDRWRGDPSVAHERTAELNEAYGVLSCRDRRRQYDETRVPEENSFSRDEAVDNEFDEALADLEQRWVVAVEIFPDLTELRARLGKIAHRLAFSFVVFLLETRRFNDRREIAAAMEQEFLSAYFGPDPQIISYAKDLVELQFREALRKLNTMVAVMGNALPASVLISKIDAEFDIPRKREDRARVNATSESEARKWARIDELRARVRANMQYEDAAELTRLLGYELGERFTRFGLGKMVISVRGGAESKLLIETDSKDRFLRFVLEQMC